MEGLTEALARIGGRAATIQPLRGGDLSEVAQVGLQEGRTVVAKAGELVATEARMLAALERAGARVPQVLAVHGQVMLLENLSEEYHTPGSYSDLGTRLTRLHGMHGEAYGWDEAYAFGKLAIDNTPLADWPDFWARRRLLGLQTVLPAEIRPRLQALARRLPEILPARPDASLLHGDLWVGNIITSQGKAWLIDPACYYGHGEVDLAMLTLFADIPQAFWQAYGYLAPGWETRRAVYQLWPALVHLVLFGGEYRTMVEELLSRLGA